MSQLQVILNKKEEDLDIAIEGIICSDNNDFCSQNKTTLKSYNDKVFFICKMFLEQGIFSDLESGLIKSPFFRKALDRYSTAYEISLFVLNAVSTKQSKTVRFGKNETREFSSQGSQNTQKIESEKSQKRDTLIPFKHPDQNILLNEYLDLYEFSVNKTTIYLKESEANHHMLFYLHTDGNIEEVENIKLSNDYSTSYIFCYPYSRIDRNLRFKSKFIEFLSKMIVNSLKPNVEYSDFNKKIPMKKYNKNEYPEFLQYLDLHKFFENGDMIYLTEDDDDLVDSHLMGFFYFLEDGSIIEKDSFKYKESMGDNVYMFCYPIPFSYHSKNHSENQRMKTEFHEMILNQINLILER